MAKKKKYEIRITIPGILTIATCIFALIMLHKWAGWPTQYPSFLPFAIVFMAYAIIASFGLIQLADMMGYLERLEDKLNGRY